MTNTNTALAVRVRQLSNGVGSVALGSLGARVAGLVSSLVGASCLGADQFGNYALLLSVTTVLATLGGMGLAAPLTRAVAREPSADGSLAVGAGTVVAAAVVLSALGLGTLLICWPGAGVASLPGATEGIAVVAVAIWAVGMGCNPLIVAVLVGLQRYRASAVLTVLRGTTVATAVVAASLLHPTAAAAAMGSAAAELVAAGAAFWWMQAGRASRSPRSAASRAGVLKVLRVGLFAGVVGLGIQASMWVGQVLLSRTPDGVAQVGLFLLASRLVLAVTFIPNALATVVLPRLSGATSGSMPLQKSGTAGAYLLVTLAVTSVAASGVTLLSLIVLPRVDASYAGNVLFFVLMGALAVLMSVNNVSGSVVVARGNLRAWIWSDVALASALLLSALLVVSGMQVTGLAFAHVVAYAASLVVLAGGYQRAAGRRWSS